jgi:hypothetical protein
MIVDEEMIDNVEVCSNNCTAYNAVAISIIVALFTTLKYLVATAVTN